MLYPAAKYIYIYTFLLILIWRINIHSYSIFLFLSQHEKDCKCMWFHCKCKLLWQSSYSMYSSAGNNSRSSLSSANRRQNISEAWQESDYVGRIKQLGQVAASAIVNVISKYDTTDVNDITVKTLHLIDRNFLNPNDINRILTNHCSQRS